MSELKVTQGAKQCQAVLCCMSKPGAGKGPGSYPGDRCDTEAEPGGSLCWVHSVALRDGMLPKDRQFFVPKAVAR